MGIPEFQKQQHDDRGVSIARLISSEFGSSEPTVRHQLDKKETVIEIDGEVWNGDRRFIPRDRLLGKTLTVIGPERHWRMKYPETY
jgi:hypothetical protein